MQLLLYSKGLLRKLVVSAGSIEQVNGEVVVTRDSSNTCSHQVVNDSPGYELDSGLIYTEV